MFTSVCEPKTIATSDMGAAEKNSTIVDVIRMNGSTKSTTRPMHQPLVPCEERCQKPPIPSRTEKDALKTTEQTGTDLKLGIPTVPSFTTSHRFSR